MATTLGKNNAARQQRQSIDCYPFDLDSGALPRADLGPGEYSKRGVLGSESARKLQRVHRSSDQSEQHEACGCPCSEDATGASLNVGNQEFSHALGSAWECMGAAPGNGKEELGTPEWRARPSGGRYKDLGGGCPGSSRPPGQTLLPPGFDRFEHGGTHALGRALCRADVQIDPDPAAGAALVRDQMVHAERDRRRDGRRRRGTCELCPGSLGKCPVLCPRGWPARPSRTKFSRSACGQAGRVCSHPGSIGVVAHGGCVFLSGPILAHEVDV